MTIRSVAEILPEPFDELGVGHVTEILRRVGEQRENIFFERKAKVTRAGIAKACCAFANTLGGLVIFGVPNDSNELEGIDNEIDEPELWVKDWLRGSVIPLPPFRARRINLANGRWLLLVLVERSSTTPHFTYQGAIYVRSGSSSEPVPIAEQRTLFELIDRGAVAEQRALEQAVTLVGSNLDRAIHLHTFVIVPTGITGDALRAIERLDPELSRLAGVLDVGEPPPISERWQQEYVHVRADLMAPWLPSGVVLPARVLTARLHRDGALVLASGFAESERAGAAELTEIREWLLATLGRTRDLLLDLGAHGDLRLMFRLRGGYGHLMYAPGRGEPLTRDTTVGVWAALDPSPGGDERVIDELCGELLRALDIRPASRPAGEA